MPYEGFLLIMVVRSQECGLIFLHKKPGRRITIYPNHITISKKEYCNGNSISYPGFPVNVFLFDVFL